MTEPAVNPQVAKPAYTAAPTTLRRSTLDIAATWVTILSVILGGAFALFRYSDDSQGARAKEALSYIERFAEPPISTSFESFTQYWVKRGFKESDTDATMVAAIQDQSVEPDALVVIRFLTAPQPARASTSATRILSVTSWAPRRATSFPLRDPTSMIAGSARTIRHSAMAWKPSRRKRH